MPLIDLTIPRGALNPETVKRLVEDLTRIVLRWEGAPPHSELARQVTWVYLNEVDSVHVAGQPATEPVYRVHATVPQGALGTHAKEGFVREVTDAIVAAEGSGDPEASFRVWCIINEVPDGNWGADGQIFTFQDIVKMIMDDRA